MIHAEVIHLTTNASGAATAYSEAFTGMIEQLLYVPGTLDTGAGLTITDEATGLAIVTVSSAGTSALRISPRAATVDASNAASLYAESGEAVETRMAVVGRVKVVVASGGDTATGRLYVVWSDA